MRNEGYINVTVIYTYRIILFYNQFGSFQYVYKKLELRHKCCPQKIRPPTLFYKLSNIFNYVKLQF